jgi:hypothetical protein
MWIRSQNKTKIMNVDVIMLLHENNDHVISGATHNDAPLDELGCYSEARKAVKVLEWIEEFIINSSETSVFQMPKDCEV